MALIGTHDSVTGEAGYGFSRIFNIFKQTQTLSIIEQAKAGIRFFDIKIRQTERGWICSNGKWETKKTFQTILKELSENLSTEFALISITYDGTLPADMKDEGFVKFVKKTIKKYDNLTLTSVSEKYKKELNQIWHRNGYRSMEHYSKITSWKRILPIPRLWKLDFPESIPSDEKWIIIVDFFKEDK